AVDEMPLAEAPVVVLDTETTGLSPALGHRVIEIAALRFQGWQETGRLSVLVNPGRPIDPGATRVHGLVDRDVAGAPSFGVVVEVLMLVLVGAIFIPTHASVVSGFLAL